MDRRYALVPLPLCALRSNALRFALSLLTLAWALAWPAPAHARAVLLRSDPPDGAVVAAAPRRLQLWLDQAAVIEPGAVSLADAAGQTVALTDVRAESYRPAEAGLEANFNPSFLFICSLGLSPYPTAVTVDLPALAPGAYSLSWRALALNDRRESAGSLVFVVDPGTATDVTPEAQSFTSTADDLLVTLSLRPNLPGANFISVRAAPLRRPLRAPLTGVTLRLTGPGGATHDVVATLAPDGTYQAAGELIDRPGAWVAEVQVGRGAAPATSVQIAWDVPSPTGQGALPWAPVALAGAGVVCGALYTARRWARATRARNQAEA